MSVAVLPASLQLHKQLALPGDGAAAKLAGGGEGGGGLYIFSQPTSQVGLNLHQT